MNQVKVSLVIPPDEYIHVVPSYHDIDPLVQKLMQRYPGGMRVGPGIPEIVVWPELRVGASVKPIFAATPFGELHGYEILDIIDGHLLLG